MHSDHQVPHHKNRHVAERLEKLVGVVVLVAVVLLAIGLVYGLMTADTTPTWMR